MGLEIDRVSGLNTSRDLAEITKLNAQVNKTDEEKKKERIAQQQEKKEAIEAHLDTYKKHAVSNAIEEQIKEQRAKIEELSKNLEGLEEEYYSTQKKADTARAERRNKYNELHQKQISERSLKRLFSSWRTKYLANKDNSDIQTQYRLSNKKYDSAGDARIHAERDYNIADADAFSAIADYNSADSAYLGGLWNKEDAYWDLARMQRNLMVARYQENLLD